MADRRPPTVVRGTPHEADWRQANIALRVDKRAGGGGGGARGKLVRAAKPSTRKASKLSRAVGDPAHQDDQTSALIPNLPYNEAIMDSAKAKAIQELYFKEQEKQREALDEIDGETVLPEVALGLESPKKTFEELWSVLPPAMVAPSDDLVTYDPENGKPILNREPQIRFVEDWYSMVPIDSMVIFDGPRRSGKSFAMRDLLYHLRWAFSHVIIFSATKHNGCVIYFS